MQEAQEAQEEALGEQRAQVGTWGRDGETSRGRERRVPGTEAKACPWEKGWLLQGVRVLQAGVWEAGPQGTRLRARHHQAVNGS